MKDFLETIKNFPDLLRQYFRVFKIAYKETKYKVIIFFVLSFIGGFLSYFRNLTQGNLINSLQQFLKTYDSSVFTIPILLFILMTIVPTFLNIFTQFINKDYRFSFHIAKSRKFREFFFRHC